MNSPLLNPDNVPIVEGTAIGIAVHALMARRTINFWTAALILVAGGALGCFATRPIAHWFGWGEDSYVLTAILVSFGAPFFFGGLMTLGDQFKDDPAGIVKRFLNARFGNGGDDGPK